MNLQEEQRVRLRIEPAEKESFEASIKRVDELREQIFKRQVFSPIARRMLRIGCDGQCHLDSSVVVKWILPEADSSPRRACQNGSAS